MEENEITQKMVRSRFLYVRELGRLVWLSRPESDFTSKNKWSVWNSRYVGTVAGYPDERGRCCIRVFGKTRKASRLTWVYHYGYWPNVIDHINGDPSYDFIENLRDVTQLENSQNRALGRTNTTGHYGVFRDAGKFRAQISCMGVKHHLGVFERLEDAVLARKAAEVKFGFHPNHGRAA